MLRARSETPTFPPLCQPVENYRYFKSKSWLNKLNSCRLLGPTPLLSSESDVRSDLVPTSFELCFHPTVVDSMYFRLHWLYSFLVCGVQFMCVHIWDFFDFTDLILIRTLFDISGYNHLTDCFQIFKSKLNSFIFRGFVT